jgi:Leucine-rich repeat (LRR) protein
MCEKAEEPSKTIVELKRMKMTGFPADLLRKTMMANANLNTIRCDINDIVALPASSSGFENLRALQLNINRLTAFPDVSQMPALKILSLSSNSMTELPESLARVCPVGLEELFINRNKITSLEAVIFAPITAVAPQGGLENKGYEPTTHNPGKVVVVVRGGGRASNGLFPPCFIRFAALLPSHKIQPLEATGSERQQTARAPSQPRATFHARKAGG